MPAFPLIAVIFDDPLAMRFSGYMTTMGRYVYPCTHDSRHRFPCGKKRIGDSTLPDLCAEWGSRRAIQSAEHGVELLRHLGWKRDRAGAGGAGSGGWNHTLCADESYPDQTEHG